MASEVNVIETEALYDVLIGLAETTISEQYDEGRLVGSDFARVLTTSITNAMQLAINGVQEQPLADAQVLAMKVNDYVMLANSQKDIELKDNKKNLVAEQVQTELAKVVSAGIDDAVKLAQSNNDIAIKGAQTALVAAQVTSEAARKALTERQATAYDDQHHIKVAKAIAGVAGMYAAGGSINATLEGNLQTAVGRI